MPKLGKNWIIGGVVVAVITVGVVIKLRQPKTTYETAKIGRGDVIHEVLVTGSIAPFKKIVLQPEVSAKVVKINAVEGAQVKSGDVLIELDAKDVLAKISSQNAAVSSARAKLDELVAGATAQEIAVAQTAAATSASKRDSAISAKADAETALTNARTNYDNAAAKADTLMSGKLATFLLDYDKALTDAADAFNRLTNPMFTTNDFLTFSTNSQVAETAAISTRGEARAKLKDMTDLVAAIKAAGSVDGALGSHSKAAADLASVKNHLEACRDVLNYASGLSSSNLSTYQSNVSAALTAVSVAIQTLSADKQSVDLQSKLNVADVTAAQIALQNAAAALSSATFAVETSVKALAQAQADLDLKKGGNRPEIIAGQRAQVASAEAALSGLLADLSKRRILSPLDGVVTAVPVEVGETVQPGTSAATMNGKGKFEIVTNISEIDIAGVQVGQPVRITLDAFPPDQVWTGRVSFINPAEKVVEGVIFYETKIVFDNEDERLRSGMTANLNIETARRSVVVRLPLRALKQQQGRSYAQTFQGGKTVETDVKIGIEDNEYAEVLSGLKEGDEVVLSETKK